ncbi:MAG TPA: glucose-6-phosphate isomerase, partial [Paracoccaceae bacterium]|nr:glucose-6-phosphate isomerase [Paracoccaceae bacterium]
DVMPAVREELARFLGFAEAVRAGDVTAVSGDRFTDVVNLGIGGSDLGPAMAVRALAPFHDGPRLHFVSNVDGAHLVDTVRGLDPARTLVIVASKTFTTQETMTNARSAKAWLEAALGERAGAHMAAVSTNLEATHDFGVEDARVFGFWDWVGGRYSLWSAIGLPLALAIGAERFQSLLEGGRAMDAHFCTAPLERNLPVALALIGIWRRNAMGWPSVAVIPYAERLARFPAYLQQLEMESNGKRVRLDGSPVTHNTAPVIWGEPGTNAQHSFFQLIHQGTDVVPVDFLVAASPNEEIGDHHEQLLANALAQSAALAFGRSEEEVRAEMNAAGISAAEIERLAPHRSFPGDRPSTTILYPKLDPFTLGRLIALYEHKVFVQGAIWDIDSFDQWGVELGKKVAISVLPALKDSSGDALPEGFDGSTAGLIAALRSMRVTALDE